MMEEGLVLDGVELWLGGRRLIGPLDLAIGPGEVATLMGPSGSGKSSLLAFICGALDPAFRAQGQIRLGGVDIGDLAPERRRLGILFQDDLMFPHLSVGGNLAFGLPPGLSSRERRAQIMAALAEAGLAGFAGGSGPGRPLCACCCPRREACCWTSLSVVSIRGCAASSANWSSIGLGPGVCLC